MNPITVDFSFEILLRLPIKSVARFVCVSKSWQQIIRSDDFIRSYSLRSSPKKQPRLIFAFTHDKLIGNQEDWCFYTKSTHVSTPLVPWEPQAVVVHEPPKPKALVEEEEPPEFLSSTVCLSKNLCYRKPRYVHGLISYVYNDHQMIYNPRTGKSITLPPVVTNDTFFTSFFGYDPSNGQHKVLCFTFALSVKYCNYQVLTLGTQNCSWKMIQCSTPHYPGTRSVCIDGALYYIASTNDTMKEPFLMRFDLRSESLEVVTVIPEGFDSSDETIASLSLMNIDSLINYNGKVAVVTIPKFSVYHFDLRILENAKKQEWSNKRLTIPTSIAQSRFHNELEILGTSDSGEIVFAPIYFNELLVVYFIDQESNQIRSVELEGSTKHKFGDFDKAHTFLHYVESVMFV